jgi:hypothetical protein
MTDDTKDGGAGGDGYSHMRGGDGVILIELDGGTKVVLTTGSGEYIVPDGVATIKVHLVAGGGGGSEGENGQPGAYGQSDYDVRPGERFRYEVGKGGAPGLNGADGQRGGDTFFERVATQELATTDA